MTGTITLIATQDGDNSSIGGKVALNDVGALDKVNLVHALAGAIKLNENFIAPNASKLDKEIAKSILGISIIVMVTGKTYAELREEFSGSGLLGLGDSLVNAIEHALITKDVPSNVMDALTNCK